MIQAKAIREICAVTCIKNISDEVEVASLDWGNWDAGKYGNTIGRRQKKQERKKKY